MHWILALTLINTGASSVMGSYDSEEACQRALKILWSMADPGTPITVGCLRADSPIAKMHEASKGEVP